MPASFGVAAPDRASPSMTSPVVKQKRPIAIVGATLLVGNGSRIEDGVLVLSEGKISNVGTKATTAIPEGAVQIDGRGRFVTPGIIDIHSHMGVYAQPGVQANADGNEMTDPTTPYVFSEHSFWPQDPALDDAVEGGVTTIQVLPGSGNVIGGRSTVLKLHLRREARAMRFPGAPAGLKMACGENPKRVYGSKGQQPMSRMGSIYKLRNAFLKAKEHADAHARYKEAHARWQKDLDRAKSDPTVKPPGNEPKAPPRHLGYETLVQVMQGKLTVHVHCYRADEMLLMLTLANELGFTISSFHHATEAYKIADVLSKEKVSVSVWADWWGFKLEAYDAVEANAGIVAAAGGIPIIHSDSPVGVQRLNQEAAKALASARRLGLSISEDEAIRWFTQNPARALGIDQHTGTLEAGKMADVAVWNRSPLSIYAQADLVYIDGLLVFDRGKPKFSHSDYDVGSAVEVRP